MCQDIVSTFFPCDKSHVENCYYEGTKNINSCIGKCENIKLIEFVQKYYSSYALERCCDIEDNTKSQPECVYVHKYDGDTKKLAIELKSLMPILHKNLQTNKKMQGQRISGQLRLDGIIEDVYKNINSLLEQIQLELPEQIYEDFFCHYILYIDYKYEEFEKIISNKGNYKIIKEMLTKNLYNYFFQKIRCALTQDTEFINIYEFSITLKNNEDILFEIYQAETDMLFCIQWRAERTGATAFLNKLTLPDKEKVENILLDYCKRCIDKFKDYNSDSYKRILLIDNQTKYSKEKLLEIIKEIELSKDMLNAIDEVWVTFYIYEDVWDYKREDFFGEKIVDVTYERAI